MPLFCLTLPYTLPLYINVNLTPLLLVVSPQCELCE